MDSFDADRFQEFIIANKIIGVWDRPVKLKSGKESYYYVNWRDATNDGFLLDQLTNFIAQFLVEQDCQCDTLYGVPEGASKTAIVAGLKLAQQAQNFGVGSHVISMGRALPKDHGQPKDRFFVGQPRGKTWVLEDTITTGGSLFAALETLVANQVQVAGVIALTDRQDKNSSGLTAREHLHKFYPDIQYLAMSTAQELLPKVLAKQPSLSAIARKAITDEVGLNF